MASTEEIVQMMQEASAEFAEADDVSFLDKMNSNIAQLEQQLREQMDESRQNIAKLEINLIDTEKSIGSLRELMKDATDEATIIKGSDKLNNLIDELQATENEIQMMNSEIEKKVSKLVEDEDNTSSEYEMISKELEQEYDPVFASNILKLKLYRSLGVRLDLDNNQILIQNKELGTIDTLPLEDELTEFFKVKYIWSRIGK